MMKTVENPTHLALQTGLECLIFVTEILTL